MLTINHCSWHVSRINLHSSQDTRIRQGLLTHPQHTEGETEAERLGTLPEATQLVNRQSRWGGVWRMQLLSWPPPTDLPAHSRAPAPPASASLPPPLHPGKLGPLTCELALLQEALQEGRV